MITLQSRKIQYNKKLLLCENNKNNQQAKFSIIFPIKINRLGMHVFLLFVLFSFTCAQPTLTGYNQFVDLSSYMNTGHVFMTSTFFLYYSYGIDYIYIGIVADTGDTTGWASFGVDNSNLMIPSDVVIGCAYLTQNLSDFNLRGKTAPSNNVFCINGIPAVCIDTDVGTGGVAGVCQDNVLNKTITRAGTFLILQYARPINASDSCDQPMTPGVTTSIVFAVGPINTQFAWPYNIAYHLVRGSINYTFVDQMQVSTASSVGTTSSAQTTNVPSTQSTTIPQATTTIAQSSSSSSQETTKIATTNTIPGTSMAMQTTTNDSPRISAADPFILILLFVVIAVILCV